MKIILEKNRSVLTEYGGYRLKYQLVEYGPQDEDGRPFYGISICQKRSDTMELFDICLIREVTDEMDKARRFFIKLVEGLVMPVSLPDLVEDWHYAGEAV